MTHPALVHATAAILVIHDATHVRVPRAAPDNPHACRFFPCLPREPIAHLEAQRDSAFHAYAEALLDGTA